MGRETPIKANNVAALIGATLTDVTVNNCAWNYIISLNE